MWVEPERHDTHSSKAYGSYGHANLDSIDASSVHSGWVSYGVQRSNATASVRADAKDRKFAKVPVSTFHIYSSTTTSPLTKNPRPGVLKSLKTPPARIPDLKNHVGFDDDEDEDITGYL